MLFLTSFRFDAESSCCVSPTFPHTRPQPAPPSILSPGSQGLSASPGCSVQPRTFRRCLGTCVSNLTSSPACSASHSTCTGNL